jgi:hypothetical protein
MREMREPASTNNNHEIVKVSPSNMTWLWFAQVLDSIHFFSVIRQHNLVRDTIPYLVDTYEVAQSFIDQSMFSLYIEYSMRMMHSNDRNSNSCD